MPYVTVATHLRVGDSLRSPVLIPLDALARSQFNPEASLTRRLSSILMPQSKYDLQKFQRRLHSPPRRSSPTRPPLKSSLKCSRPRRAIVSEPSSPPTHSPTSGSPPPNSKSVRFKDKEGELESVCHFRPTGRPSSISHPRSHSDTETETETDSTLVAQRGGPTTKMSSTMFTIADISPIPSPHTPPESNVHLESLTLLPARPPLLRGTVRVRNIAFEKCVTTRFTTDDWTTVSESHARYVGPSQTHSTWDLFAFTIPLQAPRTLLLAVRYSVPGAGEWWDNNGGTNFRIVLAPAPVAAPRPVPVPGATPSLGVGNGVSASAYPRRALVGACRANVAASRTYAYSTLPQRSIPVPPATSQHLSVS